MRLIYGTKELNSTFDTKTMDDVGIENDSILFLVFRVRGGQNIEVVIVLSNQEEKKINIDSEDTI
jgi:hypothetical protein